MPSKFRIQRVVAAVVLTLTVDAVALSTSNPAGASGVSTVEHLQADDLTDPIGVDDATPQLSWQLSTGRDVVQSAYEIRAARSEDALGSPDLWDSGKVSSAESSGVNYAGTTLRSRQRVWWQVRVWDGNGAASPWSRPAFWEMALLSPSDWSANWISNQDWLADRVHPAIQDLPSARDARYVRINITDINDTTVKPEDAVNDYRVELAELGIVDKAAPGSDLALGGQVSTSDSVDVPGEWGRQYLTDGLLTTDSAPFGYRSEGRPQATSWDNLNDPVTITIDLGQVRHFDRLLLYPRSDVVSPFGQTPNFPKNFTISVSSDGAAFTQLLKVSKTLPPPSTMHTAPPALPVFAKQFQVDTQVRSARLYVTGVGIYAATIDGNPVSQAVLEPPNADYRQQVVYSTYDVTHLLRPGANAIGTQLGNGTYDVYNTPDHPQRYQKLATDIGPPKMLAQLEITYADGRTQIVATDASWRTTLGNTTFSNWYGGEDYDVRRLPSGWDMPAADLGGWQAATPTTPPAPTTQLLAHDDPPITPVDVLHPVAITHPKDGVYVLDFGTNIAGWEQLTLDGPAGTQVTVLPTEKLTPDGVADQRTFNQLGESSGPVWDTITLDGNGPLTWHPQFVYHGFRYLELRGLASAPTADQASAIVLRTANASAGSFASSDGLLNGIHRIIDRAIQANMYSILTDCPTREKLGWLEQANLVYGSVARNYDIAAYYRMFVRDMAQAQTSQGLIQNIAPDYHRYGNGDANWGGTFVLGPWLQYKTYGDVQILRDNYAAMQHYVDFLATRTIGYLLQGGDFGDWITSDSRTPKELIQTYAYHRIVSAMSKIAAVLGRGADAQGYATLAGHIGDAVNAKYLDEAHATYSTGTQADDAFALDMGIVPANDKQAVLDHLIASIRAQGNHLTVGEIGLPAVLNALTAAGRDDVIYDLATQTTAPSWGYQVVNGATSLGEAWNGPTTLSSQNHFMLGAIDEWFTTHLGGIDQATDSVAYHDLQIKPSVLGTLDHVAASYRSPYGLISTDWTRSGASLQLTVAVPGNSTATVYVPLAATGATSATAPHGATFVGNADGHAMYRVGSGTWSFTTS
jgi:alpha-L-rhamnosidase